MKMIHGIGRACEICTDFFLQNIVRLVGAYPLSRGWLNAVYLRLTPSQRSLFHRKYSKIFRSKYVRGRPGVWKIDFVGKQILMPLTTERFWLDWDTAVSIVGHETEIKETYMALIGSPEVPDLFLDVGANYGTHSLLFLVHNIEAITYEPNSSCHDYFRQICELNGVEPHLETVALGDSDGYVELSYPEKDTWQGTTDKDVAEKLGGSQVLMKKVVKQKMLDDYLSEFENKSLLIKIDTEGNEYRVLHGALKTLQKNKPKIIFECWRDNAREKIFDMFAAQGYSIHHLPWTPNKPVQAMDSSSFAASPAVDYIAIPI